MKLTSRSYPHPVVGNGDDVPGAAFQAVVEMKSDKTMVYLDVEINCSSETISKLIAEGAGCYTAHVECSNTPFRRAYDFQEGKHRLAIQADYLNDAVEVNVFVRANRRISSYTVGGSHADYGDTSFDVDSGDILAIGEGYVFWVESNFDSLRPIGSIMQIQEAQSDGDRPMEADYNNDKIIIVLSKQDFADYKLLKNYDVFAEPLANTIVLPVLAEAVKILKDDPENDRRWARAISRRLSDAGLKLEREPLELAQQLLELPVKRTLASARTAMMSAS